MQICYILILVFYTHSQMDPGFPALPRPVNLLNSTCVNSENGQMSKRSHPPPFILHHKALTVTSQQRLTQAILLPDFRVINANSL